MFLFLFGFCVFLFLFWSWVLGSNPVQCASWCFVFVVFLIVFFMAASLSSWGAPEQQTGQTRCGRLWWSWVQLPDRCFRVLVLVWFCVFLFLFWSWVLGSNPAQCASWCFVFVVFLVVPPPPVASLSSWGAPEQQTGQTRCGRLWWSWVQLPDRCFGVRCSCLVFRVSLFVLVLGSNPVQRASWCFVFASWLPLFRAYEARPKPTETH